MLDSAEMVFSFLEWGCLFGELFVPSNAASVIVSGVVTIFIRERLIVAMGVFCSVSDTVSLGVAHRQFVSICILSAIPELRCQVVDRRSEL